MFQIFNLLPHYALTLGLFFSPDGAHLFKVLLSRFDNFLVVLGDLHKLLNLLLTFLLFLWLAQQLLMLFVEVGQLSPQFDGLALELLRLDVELVFHLSNVLLTMT